MHRHHFVHQQYFLLFKSVLLMKGWMAVILISSPTSIYLSQKGLRVVLGQRELWSLSNDPAGLRQLNFGHVQVSLWSDMFQCVFDRRRENLTIYWKSTKRAWSFLQTSTPHSHNFMHLHLGAALHSLVLSDTKQLYGSSWFGATWLSPTLFYWVNLIHAWTAII